MNVLFLTNNFQITAPLYNWLKQSEIVTLFEGIATTQNIRAKTEFIISYIYSRLIRKPIIKVFSQKIVNLHISYLQYKRGDTTNLWSFIGNTPKGVTIHCIDEGLDTGEIVVQKKIVFNDSGETYESAFNKLHYEIHSLFCENWADIESGKYAATKRSYVGSEHYRKDTARMQEGFNIKPTSALPRILNLKTISSLLVPRYYYDEVVQ
jgi:methionyl-tRNA formyltransferase